MNISEISMNILKKKISLGQKLLKIHENVYQNFKKK